MAEALDETEKRRMDLIGNLAHELRTPLASSRSMMEGLVDGVLPAEEETFVDVQREAGRLEHLTEDLVQLSRAEAGALSMEFRPTDPGTLCRDAAERLRTQFVDKEVSLELNIDSALPTVRVDHERILQVLVNLLGNALQYTDPGGSVSLRCRRTGGGVEVSVSDTGIGIADEDLGRIFERFYRVDKSRSRARGGSGIGPSIASHFIRSHSGTLAVESEGIGQGSAFSFELPKNVTKS